MLKTGVAAALAALWTIAPAQAQQANMTFFVTSQGLGNGADLGGLAGADRHCQTLAQAAGAGGKTWRAYLSTQGEGAVNARDRIGKGPWTNAKGVVVAKSVDELHGENNITKETALSEKGEVINGLGDQPNRHDILPGSQANGTAFPAGEDRTCKNYTSSAEGAVMLGHSDRKGTGAPPVTNSWVAAHPSRGCSQPALVGTGGAGLLYCFAAN
jgi:hypothetical protein